MATRSRSEPVVVVDRDIVEELVGARGDLADLHGNLQLLVTLVADLLQVAQRIETRMPPAVPPGEGQGGREA